MRKSDRSRHKTRFALLLHQLVFLHSVTHIHRQAVWNNSKIVNSYTYIHTQAHTMRQTDRQTDKAHFDTTRWSTSQSIHIVDSLLVKIKLKWSWSLLSFKKKRLDSLSFVFPLFRLQRPNWMWFYKMAKE